MSKSMMMYIDSNNFYKNVQELYDSKISIKWEKMILGIRNVIQENYDCKFSLAFYYSALSDRDDNPIVYDKQSAFLTRLNKCPYIRTVIGKLAKIPRHNGVPVDKNNPATYKHQEKSTDINISNGMLTSTAEIIVLLSADSDFSNTIGLLKKNKKTVLCVVPVGAKSSHMQHIIGDDNVILLDKEFFDKYVKVPISK